MSSVLDGQSKHRQGSSISEGYYKRIADMLKEKGDDGGSSQFSSSNNDSYPEIIS
jgi:hypothetical protein